MRWVRAVASVVSLLLMATIVPSAAQDPGDRPPTSLFVRFHDDIAAVEGHMNTVTLGNATHRAGHCDDATSDPTWSIPYASSEDGIESPRFLEDGAPRFHPEMGLARDLRLHAAQMVWHLEVPQVSVPNPMTLRVQLADGTEAAWPSDLSASPIFAQGNTTFMPSAGANEVKVPLSLLTDVIPTLSQLTLVVRLESPLHCLSTSPVEATSSPTQPSRLEVKADDGIYFEFLHPEVAAGLLLVHAATNTPWGNLDVDTQNVTLSITGPSTPRGVRIMMSGASHAHFLHAMPLEVTWLWAFRLDNATEEGGAARSGDYQLTVTAQNRMHTSTASMHATFHVDAESAYGIDESGRTVSAASDERQTPAAGFGAAVLVLAIAALLQACRSRRRET